MSTDSPVALSGPAGTFFIESTLDALLIFTATRSGILPKITRRLQEFEKRAQVQSGAVFVFDEQATGIKRWTDGLSWSPSRTLGNFLVYRELDKKAAAEEIGKDGLPIVVTARPAGSMNGGNGSKAPVDSTAAVTSLDRTRERALVGSLTSSFRFRAEGLVKKTISLGGQHMIAYYKLEDVTSGRLRTPSSHPELSALEISSILLVPAGFRVPPLIDAGPDGILRYRGEPDSPASPTNVSEYSQGGSLGTPAIDQSNSRPNSVESRRTFSPPTVVPAPHHPISPYPAAPILPEVAPSYPPARRGSGTHRTTNNRYDPYTMTRSPSLASTSNTYPSAIHSPHMRTSVSYNNYPTSYQDSTRPDDRPTYASEPPTARVSPVENEKPTRRVNDRSAGAPFLSERGRANSSSILEIGSAGGYNTQGSAGAGGAQLSRVQSEQSSFYQPRHSIPAPSQSSIQPRLPHYINDNRTPLPSIAAEGGSNVFAYQPPSNRHHRSRTSPMPPADNYQPSYSSRSTSNQPSNYTNNPPISGNQYYAQPPYQAQPHSHSHSHSINSTPSYSQQSHSSEPTSNSRNSPAPDSIAQGQASAAGHYNNNGYAVLSTASYPSYYEPSRSQSSYEMQGIETSESMSRRNSSNRVEMSRSLSERERMQLQEQRDYSRASQSRQQGNQPHQNRQY